MQALPPAPAASLDDLCPGDAIVVTGLVSDAAVRGSGHGVGIVPSVLGQPLEVVRVVPPFVLAHDASGRLFTLDARRQEIARVADDPDESQIDH